MVIPEDLPPELAPLTWMLGTWSGWGMWASGEDEPDRVVLEEVEADIVGTHMRMTTTIRLGEVEGDVDPMLDATQGLDLIGAGRIVREETVYIKVLPGSGVLPPPGEYEPRELMGSGADMDGMATLWAGVSLGPRVQLVSDAIARDAQAEPIEHLARMYGLVAGEMMWTQERTLAGEDTTIDVSGRLIRVAYLSGDEGETGD